MYHICLIAAIMASIIGQLALKVGALNGANIQGIPLFDPYTILGLFCYGLGALFYIYALKGIPVSVAFPCASFSYVAIAIIAHFVWNEPLGLQHGVALLFIISGVLLLIKA